MKDREGIVNAAHILHTHTHIVVDTVSLVRAERMELDLSIYILQLWRWTFFHIIYELLKSLFASFEPCKNNFGRGKRQKEKESMWYVCVYMRLFIQNVYDNLFPEKP